MMDKVLAPYLMNVYSFENGVLVVDKKLAKAESKSKKTTVDLLISSIDDLLKIAPYYEWIKRRGNKVKGENYTFGMARNDWAENNYHTDFNRVIDNNDC